MQYGTNVNVRLPQATLDAIDKEAENQSRTRSNLIRKILADWVKFGPPIRSCGIHDVEEFYADDTPASYTTELKQMLKEMSKDDLRTLSGQLEYLVRQEHERRQAPRTLVDTPAPYRTEGQP